MNEAKFVTAFADKLRAVPHRDITHTAYVDWFSLYVNLTKQMPLTARAARASRAHLRLVDNMLWSSLVAPRWNEVDVFLDHSAVVERLARYQGASSTTSTSSSPFSEQLWFRRVRDPGGVGLSWADTRAEFGGTAEESEGVTRGGSSLCCDLVTSDFLAEPLLGGQAIENWRQALRQQSEALNTAESATAGRAASSASTEDGDVAAEATHLTSSIVLIPFSAMWAIKEQAFLHTGAATSTDKRPLTLQERGARQVLLQSLHQLLQLQVELSDKQRRMPAPARAAPAPRLQLAVLAPSEEFDLLCGLPRLQRAHQTSQSPQDVSLVATAPCLQLHTVCENPSARLVYFLLHQLAESPRTAAWHLVAPTATHTTLRRCAAGALQAVPVRAQTQFQLSSLDTLGEVAGRGLAPGESTVRSVHRQARQGCQDTVRRMAQREENLRQSYSQK